MKALDLTLDLRVLDLERGTKLAPVVTAKLELEAAKEAVTFQIPIEALDRFREELSRIRSQLLNIDNIVQSDVPKWARLNENKEG